MIYLIVTIVLLLLMWATTMRANSRLQKTANIYKDLSEVNKADADRYRDLYFKESARADKYRRLYDELAVDEDDEEYLQRSLGLKERPDL